MGNNRKQIREKIAALLVNETIAGARVFETRTTPIWEADLPAITVYTESESCAVFDYPRRYRRNLTLAVEVFAEANDNLDDTLDTLSAQVEDLLTTDESLGGLVNDTQITGTEVNLVADGKITVGSAKISLAIEYFTDIPDGETVDFSSANTRWDTKKNNGKIEAIDQTELGNL